MSFAGGALLKAPPLGEGEELLSAVTIDAVSSSVRLLSAVVNHGVQMCIRQRRSSRIDISFRVAPSTSGYLSSTSMTRIGADPVLVGSCVTFASRKPTPPTSSFAVSDLPSGYLNTNVPPSMTMPT